MLAAFPLTLIMGYDNESNNDSDILRLAKLPKLYRLIRITKLIRLIKMFKGKNKNFLENIEMFSINKTKLRLFLFLISIFIFCHLNSCLWYLIARLLNFPEGSWFTINRCDTNKQFDFCNYKNFPKFSL